MIDKTKVYYLASPYSSDNDFIRQLRFEAVNYVATQLILKGYILIEPIAMCHSKSQRYDLPVGYEYWKTRDRKMIEISDGVLVLTIDGWTESIGVTDEIDYARSLGKQIIYLDPTIFFTLNERNVFNGYLNCLFTKESWEL